MRLLGFFRRLWEREKPGKSSHYRGRRSTRREPNRDLALREARDLIGLGMARRGLGKFSDAESDLRAGADLHETANDNDGKLDALNELAMTLVAANRDGDAQEIWKQIVESPGNPDQPGELPKSIYDFLRGKGSLAISQLGGITLQVEKLNAARRMIAEAQRTGDRQAEAEGLLQLSEARRQRRMDVSEAIRLANQAVAIFHNLHHVGEARAYYALGRAQQDAKQTKDALVAYQTSAKLAKSFGTPQVQAQALEGTGSLLTATGKQAEGIESLQLSVKLFHRIGDAIGEGRARSSLGRALLDRGLHNEAVTEFRAAITLCRSAGELFGRAAAQINLPIALIKAGQYRESIASSLESLDVCREIGYREGTDEALANLGFAYLMEGQYSESRQRYNQLLDRIPKQHSPGNQRLAGDVTAVVRNSGVACAQAGDSRLNASRYKESVEAYGLAVELFAASGSGKDEATALLKLGAGLSALGSWEDGNEAYQRAYKISKQQGERSLAAIARAVLGGNLVDFSSSPEQALPHLLWALKEGQEIGDARVVETAAHNLQVAHRKLGKDVARAHTLAERAATPARTNAEPLSHEELLRMADNWPNRIPAENRTWRFPIGIAESSRAPAYLDFNRCLHCIIIGDAKSGKTSLLRSIAHSICASNTNDQVKIILVDYHRTLLNEIPGEYIGGWATNVNTATELMEALRDSLRERMPGPEVSPEQRVNRSWWLGPDVCVIIDDYDRVAASTSNPIDALLEFLPHARDLGFHVILARRADGAGRAMLEPVLARMGGLGSARFIMSCERGKDVLIGTTKPSKLPPGHGTLVTAEGEQRIRTSWLPPASGGTPEATVP